MILVRRGIDHCALPVSNLQQLEATAISAKISGRPVKLVAVYLSPLHSLLDADLSECFGVGKPVFWQEISTPNIQNGIPGSTLQEEYS